MAETIHPVGLEFERHSEAGPERICVAARALIEASRRPVDLVCWPQAAALLPTGSALSVCMTCGDRSSVLTRVSIEAEAGCVLGNLLLFRLGAPDALALSAWLDHPEQWRTLCRQADFKMHARLLEQGRPVTHANVSQL